MKRLWFALIFLLIAICGCCYEQYIVKTTYNDISMSIDMALNADKSEEKEKYCNEITDKWDKYVQCVTLVTDHSILQSADVSISTINELAEESSDSLDEALIQAKSELNLIYDSSKINFSNIF